MAPSDSDSVEAYCERIADAEPSARDALAGDLQRYVLTDLPRWIEVTDDAVQAIAPFVDADSPTVRATAVFVLRYVAEFDPDRLTFERSRAATPVLEAFEDADRRVRQVATNPFNTGTLVSDALEDDAFRPKSKAWVAETLLERLREPVPVVRKRAAWHVEKNAVALGAAHPDVESVVAALVDAFEDPLDANAPDRRARSPRYAALRALEALAPVEPGSVSNHVDAVAAFLDDDRLGVPNRAEGVLVSLHEAGCLSGSDAPEAVDDFPDDR
ncbi:hypothetical protein [Halorubellus sp. PRR65]|uniref:hypothetical protein n=1 Tax=Halorubellus sp. PRR65 TaxID=3098148 RepID=UPI002B2610D3|nr:hypothetical protein [Halorubellus sp. PRR65]